VESIELSREGMSLKGKASEIVSFLSQYQDYKSFDDDSSMKFVGVQSLDMVESTPYITAAGQQVDFSLVPAFLENSPRNKIPHFTLQCAFSNQDDDSSIVHKCVLNHGYSFYVISGFESEIKLNPVGRECIENNLYCEFEIDYLVKIQVNLQQFKLLKDQIAVNGPGEWARPFLEIIHVPGFFNRYFRHYYDSMLGKFTKD